MLSISAYTINKLTDDKLFLYLIGCVSGRITACIYCFDIAGESITELKEVQVFLIGIYCSHLLYILIGRHIYPCFVFFP